MNDDSATIRRLGPGALERLARAAWRSEAPRLQAVSLRIVGRLEEADDVVQDVWLKLLEKPPALPAGALGAWLTRVTINASIDRVRRRRDVAPPPDDSPLWGRATAPSGAAIDLERALAKLPEGARLVFVLHDVEGLRHEEVAEALGITAGTSKSQLFRARELLRAALGRRGDAGKDDTRR
jgi:RNA polymerase sigma-70 factor (ECF subfamily)